MTQSNFNSEMKKELIHGLKVLDPENRNIGSLTIWCNPNFSNGSDSEIKDRVLLILQELIIDGQVIQEKSPKNRSIYTFIHHSKKHSKKLGVSN
ncbi:MAG: hypothetical protein ACFFDH_21515 [Promethearchaeota archaeon]